ncbi:unnamed protein product [Rotaria sp. Silwood1]|nr:unnamed protein product [Rotaria sp. Silwood1]CAF1452805.1 unnamed protein product [Rotaria sp. Silwood1]
MGYWNRFGTDISAESLINSHAHKACYIKITRKLPPIKIQQQRVLKHSPLAKNGQNDVSLSKPVENPNAEEDTLEKEVTEINQSSTVLNNCDENVPDICSNEFSEIMYGSTTNGSSIAMCRKKVVSLESTNIDLNARLVEPEQNLDGSGSFLCNQSYINEGTIEQENHQNQQQTTSGQHADAYEIFNSCKELSMENITIEDQSNIGTSILNKIDYELNVNTKSRKKVKDC